MEKSPDNDSATDEPDDGATILRFPRDWFGPPEELVPFGPRAGRSAVSEREAGGGAPEEASGSAPADVRPPRADAFWTEESAAVHDAVQAAEPFEVPEAAGSRTGGHRRNVAIACGAAAVVGVAATLALQGGRPRPLRTGATSAAVHLRTWTAISRAPARATRVAKRAPQRATSATRVRETKPVVTQSTSARSSAPPAAAAATPAPAASSSSGAGEAQPSGSSRPSASVASAGPSSSQPAFGANGALGPGHSPNS